MSSSLSSSLPSSLSSSLSRTVSWAVSWTLAVVLIACLAPTARAQSLPQLTAPVNDFAHVIDAQSAALLDTRIRALERATGDAVVVATVQTFAPYGTIEEYAVKLYEQAGIGARSKDNGVLIVMALNERRVRIETGYGLEEFITDGFAGETIRQAILPAFRSGNYGQGLLAGTTRVIQRIAERRGVTLSDIAPEQPTARVTHGISIGQIIFVIVLLIILSNMFGGRRGGSSLRRRGGWGGPWGGGFGGFGGGGFGGGFGGSGGGGFGGFGGGRSGGGGASGGW